jgi:hypothetical protein
MFHTYLSSEDGKVGIFEVMVTKIIIIIIIMMVISVIMTLLVTQII